MLENFWKAYVIPLSTTSLDNTFFWQVRISGPVLVFKKINGKFVYSLD